MGASQSVHMDTELKVKNLIISYLKTIDIKSTWRFYKNDDGATGIFINLPKYNSSIDILHKEVILARSEKMEFALFSQIRKDFETIAEDLGFGVSYLDVQAVDPDDEVVDFTFVETPRTNAVSVN
jgi:hypothetical protein